MVEIVCRMVCLSVGAADEITQAPSVGKGSSVYESW